MSRRKKEGRGWTCCRGNYSNRKFKEAEMKKEKINVEEGYLLEDIDGNFLNEKLEWENTAKEKAHLHPGSLIEIVKLVDEHRLSVYNYYPAMMINNILLRGKALGRIGDNQFIISPDE